MVNQRLDKHSTAQRCLRHFQCVVDSQHDAAHHNQHGTWLPRAPFACVCVCDSAAVGDSFGALEILLFVNLHTPLLLTVAGEPGWLCYCFTALLCTQQHTCTSLIEQG